MSLLLLSLALADDATLIQERVEATRPWRAERLADPLPTIDAHDYATAAKGKVATGITRIDGHAAKMGYGVGVLDAPIDAVWAAINDETRHGDLVPLSHVELVQGAPCQDGRKVLMVLPLPIVSDRYWVNENRYASALATTSHGAMRELSWSSVADPSAEPMSEAGRAASDGLVPIGYNRGAWLLIDLGDGRTLAEYHSWVDPGGSLPAGPAATFASGGIVDAFEAMETYAKRGALPCR